MITPDSRSARTARPPVVVLPSHPAPLPISFSGIISALTFAIDLTEGAVPGHALRSCLLGLRIAEAVDLPAAQMPSLYYALMLKDSGCSNNAARMCQIVGGDDRVMKIGVKLQDWTRPHRPTLDALKLLWTEVLPLASPIERLMRIGRIALTQHRNNAAMISLRCERGAEIAEKLGLSAETAQAIHDLDEHWDGSGYPGRLKGAAIPLLARILSVAQHLDVFASERDERSAMQVLAERSGRWFDPALVQAAFALDRNHQLWTRCRPADDAEAIRKLVMDVAPEQTVAIGEEHVDRICEAFAEVVDAKSPFTYRHSIGVADVATQIARVLRLAPDRVRLVRRAALLHDLGKLGVSNTILDKPGELNPVEWEAVVQHPRLTHDILARIDSFAELAEVAGAHHEKLDGSGYPHGLTGAKLSLEARIVAVADVYQAMIERRPYRDGMSHVEAMKVMHRLAGQKLDPHCVVALGIGREPVFEGLPVDTGSLPRPEVHGVRKGPSAEHSGIAMPAMSA
jgi:putative nucleotidyltransferase with HDIG domain